MGWGSINEDNWEAVRQKLDPMPITAPIGPRLRCPGALGFEAEIELAEHIIAEHQHQRPVLLIGGREPTANHKVRNPLSASDINTLFCTGMVMEISGRRVAGASSKNLGDLLAALKDERVLLTLTNDAEPGAMPETSSYDIRVEIPDPSDLNVVDSAFVKHLADDQSSLASSQVTSFLRACPDSGPASEYAGALADYVLGVLAKDQVPGTTVALSPADYDEKFKRAHAVLVTLERPVARLMTGLISFGLNDFPRDPIASGYTRLDDVASRLAILAGQTWPPMKADSRGARRRRICPTDTGTDVVLATAEHLHDLSRWGRPAVEMLHAALDALRRFPLDRAKLAALGAQAALRLAAHQDATILLRRLVNNPAFGHWADRELTQLENL